MFIIDSKEKKAKFKKEIERYSFRNIKRNTKFFEYKCLEDFYRVTKQYTKLKAELFGI